MRLGKTYGLCNSDQQVKFHSEKLGRDEEEASRRRREASKRGYTDPRPAPLCDTVATKAFESFIEQIMEDLGDAFEGKNFRQLGATLRKLQDFRRQGIVDKRDKLGRSTIKVFSDEQIKTMEEIDDFAALWMRRTTEQNASSLSSSPSWYTPDTHSNAETEALG